jgi:hypothetical protein
MTDDPGSPQLPAKQAPAARIETTVEADEAKKKVRRRAQRATGRDSQILAGQLTQTRNDNQLKQILG